MSENGILGVECLLIPYNKEMQVKNMIGQSDLTRDQTAPLKIGGLSDMSNQYVFNDRLPLAPLKIAALESCRDLAQKVNDHIVNFRRNDAEELLRRQGNLQYRGYDVDSYLLDCACPRFGSGEAKGMIHESVRGYDLYIMTDVTNYSLTYKLCGHENHMSPDDHYQDLKRMIAAANGKARRITVIMPFLYESRQHRRTARESMDCALALQELIGMGVDNIITFDAHDPRVQNAIPLHGFDTVQPAYQFVKGILNAVDDLKIDNDHLMIISPDEGATSRAVFLASVLGVDMGMFYKRRDYSHIVDGTNPIVAHEFLGSSLDGKDVWVVDDMISSGGSVLEVAAELKKRKANRVFICSTFGLFTNGMEKFDKAYEAGMFDFILTTNLVYQTPELLQKPYYINCDLSKYIAYIIDTLNHDASISSLLNPLDRINKFLKEHNS